MSKEKLDKYYPLETAEETAEKVSEYEYNMKESFITEHNQHTSKVTLERSSFGIIKDGKYAKTPFLKLKQKMDKCELRDLHIDPQDTEFLHGVVSNADSIRIFIEFLVDEMEYVDLDMETIILKDIPWIAKQVEAFMSEEGKYAFIALAPSLVPILSANNERMPRSAKARLMLYKFDGNIYIIICDDKSIVFTAGKVPDDDKKEIYRLLKYVSGMEELTPYQDSII